MVKANTAVYSSRSAVNVRFWAQSGHKRFDGQAQQAGKGNAAFCRAGDPVGLADEARDALTSLHDAVVTIADLRANQLNNWGQIWGHLMAQGQYLGQKNDLEWPFLAVRVGS